MTSVVRIGTRGSPLARIQTELVSQALRAADPALAAPGALEVVVIRTTGDRVVDRPLAELGGKGLFCKELEAALLERRIDLAVHSMKDLPTWLPDGLAIGAMLPRADPRDVLIARAGPCRIADLPRGALVGTASLRRRAQLLAQPSRPRHDHAARQSRHPPAQACRRARSTRPCWRAAAWTGSGSSRKAA